MSTTLQQLVHNAVMAHDAGADMHHPAFRAMAQHPAMQQEIDLGTYRRARRGLGLSKRQARERVAEIEGFSLAGKIRDAVTLKRARRLFGRKADAMLANGELGTWTKPQPADVRCCAFGAEMGFCPEHDGRRA